MTNTHNNLSETSGKFMLCAAFAAVAAVALSNVCCAEPYVVIKGGTSKWEDFDGDDKDTYASLGVGFNAGKYLSFELAYNDLGEVTADALDQDTVDAFSTSISAYVRWPMFTHFGLFLNLGLESWKADVETPEFNDRVYGTGAFAGVGAKANAGPVDISVFYELHKLDEKGQPQDGAIEYDDFDIDVVGAGVAYRF